MLLSLVLLSICLPPELSLDLEPPVAAMLVVPNTYNPKYPGREESIYYEDGCTLNAMIYIDWDPGFTQQLHGWYRVEIRKGATPVSSYYGTKLIDPTLPEISTHSVSVTVGTVPFGGYSYHGWAGGWTENVPYTCDSCSHEYVFKYWSLLGS